MSKFEVNEIVVVKDGSQYYESKILKVECFSKVWKYFVHYQGWKRRWDCWVDDSLVFKLDEEGSKKLKESKQSQKKKSMASLASKSVLDSSASDTGNNPVRSKKRAQEESLEFRRRKKHLLQTDMCDEEHDVVPVLKLLMPLTLKKQMIDEWKMVTGSPGRLLSLPRELTVNNVIEEFLKHKESKIDGKAYQRYVDLFQGLKLYFDKALPLVLLYRQEREQYDEFTLSNAVKLPPSDIYGMEHLLRLFVRIPHMSTGATIVPSDATFVQQKLLEFLKYMQKNSSKCFHIADYILAEKVDA